MNRSWIAVTPLVAVFLMAGCNGDGDATNSTSTTVVATTQAPPTTATTAPTDPPATDPDQPATTAPTSNLPTDVCLARMQEAVDSAEDYIEKFYPALAECTGLADWLAAVEQTGFEPGEDPVVWAANVCALDGPIVAVTCQEAIEAAREANG